MDLLLTAVVLVWCFVEALSVILLEHGVILTALQSLANDNIRVVLGSPSVFQVMPEVRKIGRTIL